MGEDLGMNVIRMHCMKFSNSKYILKNKQKQRKIKDGQECRLWDLVCVLDCVLDIPLQV